jgi:integrase
MSMTPTSRVSFAEVIVLISQADLSGRRKEELRSAVRTVARLLGTEPAAVAADPAALRRRLQSIAPEAHGISRGRWANVRSLLVKALAMARPMMAGRSKQAILPQWVALTATLPFSRSVRLLAFLRFLSARGHGPAEVSVADFYNYRDAIMNDRLRKDPEKSWDRLVWVWNWCRREVGGWPAIVIERPTKAITHILPWSAFPPAFKDDVDRFLARLSGADLSGDGPPRPARPATLQKRSYQLRVAASALVHRGHDADTVRTIADLLSLERYQDILRFFLDRHGGQTSSQQAAEMAAFLKGAAKHWVRVDEPTLEKMKRIASRLAIPRRGMTAKNRERLRPLDDPEIVAAFLALPQRLRHEVETSKRSPRNKAILAQMAAAIALLQAAPIRLKNLTAIDVNKNLIARGKRLYLVIAESEVKNNEPIDFEPPAETRDILARYVREHRPLLISVPTDALFPGPRGGAKSSNTLARQIPQTVFRFAGLRINVHLFRHAAGKLFLDARPGQYEVMRRVLGHRSIATTTSIYSGAETRSAGSHFAAVISERRRALEQQSKKATSTLPRRSVKGGGLA